MPLLPKLPYQKAVGKPTGVLEVYHCQPACRIARIFQQEIAKMEIAIAKPEPLGDEVGRGRIRVDFLLETSQLTSSTSITFGDPDHQAGMQLSRYF